MEVCRIFWPITITSANDRLEFTVVGGGSAGNYTGAVANATYYTPELFLAAVQTAYRAALASCVTFTLSAAGKVTATWAISGATSVTMIFTGDSENQCLGTLLGWDTGDNTAAALAHTAEFQMQHMWTPGVPVESDSGHLDEYTRAVVETAGQQVFAVENGTSFQVRRLKFSHLEPCKVLTLLETTDSTENESFQRLISDVTAIVRFRYWPDRTSVAGTVGDGTVYDYYIRPDFAGNWRPERMTDYGMGYNRYRFEIEFGEYNA